MCILFSFQSTYQWLIQEEGFLQMEKNGEKMAFLLEKRSSIFGKLENFRSSPFSPPPIKMKFLKNFERVTKKSVEFQTFLEFSLLPPSSNRYCVIRVKNGFLKKIVMLALGWLLLWHLYLNLADFSCNMVCWMKQIEILWNHLFLHKDVFSRSQQ